MYTLVGRVAKALCKCDCTSTETSEKYGTHTPYDRIGCFFNHTYGLLTLSRFTSALVPTIGGVF